MNPVICYSSEQLGNISIQLAKPHYSYRFAEDALIRLLDRAGYTTHLISEPQNFKHPIAYRELLNSAPDDVVHIAFRSTENIRPMYGAKNLCHFAWEFEVMSNSGLLTDSILNNQVHMLSLMDEIWVACEYSKRVLEKYNLRNTYVVPAPVVDDHLPKRLELKEILERIGMTPTLPLLLNGGLSPDAHAEMIAQLVVPLSGRQCIRDRVNGAGGRIFLAVLNPHDLRKNLLNLIEGFQIARDSLKTHDILIIKLIVSNRGDFRSRCLTDGIMPRFNGPLSYQDQNIVLIADYLTDPEMDALFSLADYYLSASHGEGFNRPLLQAMSFGSVPVSTRNTAMEDYLDEGNALVIPERRFLSPIAGMAGDVARVPYFLDYATRFDVAQACRAAMLQDQSEFTAMSDRARRVVLDKYGERAVLQLVTDRLAHLAGLETGA